MKEKQNKIQILNAQNYLNKNDKDDDEKKTSVKMKKKTTK